MGEEELHPIPESSRPHQEALAGAREAANTREVTRGLREIARVEAIRSGPGSHCPLWLAVLLRSGGQ